MDEYRTKGGMDLIAALEVVKRYAASSNAPEEVTAESADRANARALAELEKMMKGVR